VKKMLITCDRCGREIPEEEDYRELTERDSEEIVIDVTDLCLDCYVSYNEFMNTKGVSVRKSLEREKC
jgi:hypothetical protein